MLNPDIIRAAADLYMDRGMSRRDQKLKLDILIAQLEPKDRELIFGQIYILINF